MQTFKFTNPNYLPNSSVLEDSDEFLRIISGKNEDKQDIAVFAFLKKKQTQSLCLNNENDTKSKAHERRKTVSELIRMYEEMDTASCQNKIMMGNVIECKKISVMSNNMDNYKLSEKNDEAKSDKSSVVNKESNKCNVKNNVIDKVNYKVSCRCKQKNKSMVNRKDDNRENFNQSIMNQYEDKYIYNHKISLKKDVSFDKIEDYGIISNDKHSEESIKNKPKNYMIVSKDKHSEESIKNKHKNNCKKKNVKDNIQNDSKDEIKDDSMVNSMVNHEKDNKNVYEKDKKSN